MKRRGGMKGRRWGRTWVMFRCTAELRVSVDSWMVCRISCKPSCCGVQEVMVGGEDEGAGPCVLNRLTQHFLNSSLIFNLYLEKSLFPMLFPL